MHFTASVDSLTLNLCKIKLEKNCTQTSNLLPSFGLRNLNSIGIAVMFEKKKKIIIMRQHQNPFIEQKQA